MLFILIRIIILIMTFIIEISIFKKLNKKPKFQKLILIIVLWLSVMFPFDLYILKFKDLNSAFNYRYSYKKIIYTHEYSKYGIVISSSNNEKDITVFQKNQNKWKYNSRIWNPKGIMHNSNYNIILKRVKNTNSYFIFLEHKKNKDNASIIKDSLDNEYSKFDDNYYYLIEDIPEDYYFLIDDEKIEVKEFINNLLFKL